MRRPITRPIFRIIITVLVTLIGISNTPVAFSFDSKPAAPATSICPDRAAGETDQDCPWAGVARTLIAEARAGHAIGDQLAALLPKLDRDLKADAGRTGLKDVWGMSINFDEIAKSEIVDNSILSAIGEKIEIDFPIGLTAQGQARPPMNRIVHAGMEHTYGYLFSVLKTPFGFKRARWVRGEIETGFNLPVGILGPTPSSGTLFLNVTTFIGNIAFRTDSTELAVVKSASRSGPKELSNFKYGKLSPTRLEERVEVPNYNGKTRLVTLRTDFVPFLNAPSDPNANSHLLIYSVVDPFHHEAQLISAFPVQTSFVQNALNPKGLGSKPVSTRYNGFVEGLSGTTLHGDRRVLGPRVSK